MKERNVKMRKLKKVLAFSLASAMIVSTVPVIAAKNNTAKAGKTTIYYNGNQNYKSTWIKTATKKGYTVKFFNQTTKIASLDKKSGKVTAKKAGTAKIKVNFYKGKKLVSNKILKIAVKKAPVVKGIKAENNSLSIGETTKIVTSSAIQLKYYSANKKIAKVNKTTGVVTAVSAGTTKIAVVNPISGKKVYVGITVNAEFTAKQTGAREFTITGSGFTEFTFVDIRKGKSYPEYLFDHIKISEDGTKLIVPMKNEIQTGEYTIGIDDQVVTVKCEASKVTSIDISDVAVVDKGVTLPISADAVANKATGATISYVVKNQFGEDITKKSNVQVNSTRTVYDHSQKGKLHVSLNPQDKKDDIISVLLFHKETALTSSKNVKISDKAVAKEVKLAGIYHESNEELTEHMAQKNLGAFYYLFDVVDQFGHSMADKKFKIGTTMDSDLIVNVNSGLTNVTLDTANVTVKIKDGKDYIAVPLTKSAIDRKVSTGKGTIIAMTKLGQSYAEEFEVKSGKKVDNFTVTVSDVVVSGKETVLDFTATDEAGNDISNIVTKDMFFVSSQAMFDPANGDYFKFGKNQYNGKNQLVFVAKDGSKRGYAGSFITATGKVVPVQFTIEEASKPRNIGTVETIGILTTEPIIARNLAASELDIIDQYGKTYTFEKFRSVDKSGYSLDVELVKGDSVTAMIPDYLPNQVEFYPTGKAGVTTFKFVLKGEEDGMIKTYEEEFCVMAKHLDDLVKSADDLIVDPIPKMYYNSKRKPDVHVKSDGVVFPLLPDDDFVVITNGVQDWKISGSAIKIADGQTEATGKYSIVVKNKLGTEVVKDITVCKEEPKAAKINLRGKSTVAPGVITKETILKLIRVKDQYDEEMTQEYYDKTQEQMDQVRVQFKDCSNKDTVATNNNTSKSSIQLNEDEAVTAVLTFPGGFVYTVTISAKAPAKK